MPGASLGTMIPRVLVHSEVTTSGDTVEILRPRHDEALIRRYFAHRMTKAKRYECYPLDARGSRIWCLIDNQRCVAELVAEYLKVYPDDYRQLDERVHRYLETLVDHGFIEIVPG